MPTYYFIGIYPLNTTLTLQGTCYQVDNSTSDRQTDNRVDLPQNVVAKKEQSKKWLHFQRYIACRIQTKKIKHTQCIMFTSLTEFLHISRCHSHSCLVDPNIKCGARCSLMTSKRQQNLAICEYSRKNKETTATQ